MSNLSEQKNFGYGLMLVLASLIWGVSFVAQAVGMDAVGLFTFSAVRSFLAALALIPCYLIADKKDGGIQKNRDKKLLWKSGILVGFALFVAVNLQQWGILYTTSGKAGFITSLYIVLVPLYGIALKKRVHPMVWCCVVLAAVGLYFLSIKKDFSFNKGDFYVFLCALVFAVHIQLVSYFAPKVDCIRMSCIQFLVVAVLSAVPALLFEHSTFAQIKSAWLPIVYAGVFSGAGGYTLQILGEQRIEPTAAALLLSPEAVFSAIAGWLLLGETLTGRELLGCGLVFCAVILSQLPWRRIFIKKASNVSSHI